jgi:hypothetical protein
VSGDLLSELADVSTRLAAVSRERDRLFDRRDELFVRLRDEQPDVPLSNLAAQAGISVPAVIQRIAKVRAR